VVVLRTPPTIDYTLTPATPTGLNGWYKGDVSLVWNIAYPTPNMEPITDAVNQDITVDQPATDYSGSVTVIGGSAGPVTVTIKRDATPPVITWESLINDGDSFLVGSVPAEPTVAATDATSGTDGATLTGYGTAVGSHTLVATASDAAGNVRTEQWGYTVTLKPATVLDPTAIDQTWDGSAYVTGGITIPTVVGADYFLEGAPASGGFNALDPGTYAVTAQAQADYELRGYPVGGWSLTIDAAIVPVVAEMPTAIDQTWDGTAFVSGAISIPAVDGVNYFIVGAPAAAGLKNMDPGTYSVSAEAQAGYALQTYDGPWSLTINAAVIPDIEVTPVKPTVKNESVTGTLDGGITIPAVTGVDYFIDDALEGSGFKALAVGSYVVTVQAQQGYVLANDTSPWTLVVGKDVPPKVIQFVGVASAGSNYVAANTVGLPAGWQPGDMAIVMASNNTTATPPVVPAGWNLVAGPSISTSPYAVSRVGTRILQAGDTSTGVWTNTKDIVVVVYRNVGSIGAVTSSGLSFTAGAPYKVIPLPALSFQVTNGSSWLVGLGYFNDAGNTTGGRARNLSAPAGTINRTTSAAAAVSYRLGVIDSNRGVTGWAGAQPILGTPSAAASNGVSLELRVAP
jgi:hypothetical protein